MWLSRGRKARHQVFFRNLYKTSTPESFFRRSLRILDFSAIARAFDPVFSKYCRIRSSSEMLSITRGSTLLSNVFLKSLARAFREASDICASFVAMGVLLVEGADLSPCSAFDRTIAMVLGPLVPKGRI